MTFRKLRPIIIALAAPNIGVNLGGFLGLQAYRRWFDAIHGSEVGANPDLGVMGVTVVVGGFVGFGVFAILGLRWICRFDPSPNRASG